MSYGPIKAFSCTTGSWNPQVYQIPYTILLPDAYGSFSTVNPFANGELWGIAVLANTTVPGARTAVKQNASLSM
jgi:hypothetical protein